MCSISGFEGGLGGLKPTIYLNHNLLHRNVSVTENFKLPYINLFIFSSPPKVLDLDPPMMFSRIEEQHTVNKLQFECKFLHSLNKGWRTFFDVGAKKS